MPLSVGPGVVHVCFLASIAEHVGTLMPWATLVMSLSAVSRSEAKIVVRSGSYVSVPSFEQVVVLPIASVVSLHSSGDAAAPAAVCQCL